MERNEVAQNTMLAFPPLPKKWPSDLNDFWRKGSPGYRLMCGSPTRIVYDEVTRTGAIYTMPGTYAAGTPAIEMFTALDPGVRVIEVFWENHPDPIDVIRMIEGKWEVFSFKPPSLQP